MYFQQYRMYSLVPICIKTRKYNTTVQGTQEHYVYTFYLCIYRFNESTLEQ